MSVGALGGVEGCNEDPERQLKQGHWEKFFSYSTLLHVRCSVVVIQKL